MKLKRSVAILLALLMSFGCLLSTASAQTENDAAEVFYDDFSGDSLDQQKWLIAEKSWGGNNGGVVPQNVSVSGGTLKLEGHGNYYTGNVPGISRPDGKRTGAAIATREYFGSGSYEVVSKVAPQYGACSAIWTFEYEEYYPGDEIYEQSGATGQYYEINHEIDIEIPGRVSSNADPDFRYALCNTFVRENRVTTGFTELPYAVDDGQFHTYRFDWHTGDDGQTPRVEYYIDGSLININYTNIPTNAGRFWIGIWFPCSKDSDNDGYCDTGWTGTANFDTTVFEIESVRITPFHEAGDTPQRESFGYDGWASDSFPELIEAENYEHVVNGSFSDGSEGWKLSGSAEIANCHAILAPGKDTDGVSQQVHLQQKMTYSVVADVVTDGTEVEIGIRKPNGSQNTSITTTQSGKIVIPFTTADAATLMEVYASVERYQDTSAAAYVDNVSLYSGIAEVSGEVITPVEPEGPGTPESTDPIEGGDVLPAENLLNNGDFSADDSFWNKSGGAVIADGYATLISGSDTDTIKQQIGVKKNTTYTLAADVQSSGTEVSVGVKDYNGRYSETAQTLTADGRIVLTFTTASHIDMITVFAEVLRYQDERNAVRVDNMILVEGTELPEAPGSGTGEETEPDPGSGETPENPGTDPDAGETPDEPTPVSNLVSNGDFADGTAEWKLSGSAEIAGGFAALASGSDTDSIKQQISVKKGTTYTLSADVVSSGAEVSVGVKDYNGRYTELAQTLSESGKVTLTFTTASHIDTISVFAEVLRYQANTEAVCLDNIILVEGTEIVLPDEPAESEEPSAEDTDTENDPAPTEPSPVVNLLSNGDFSSGSECWKTSGSARIQTGSAILASGRDTDTIKQTISLEPYTTYRLSADIETAGSVVDLKVEGYTDDKYASLTDSVDASGLGEIVFTTGGKPKSVSVVLQVLRYQSDSSDCTVHEVVLTAE